ncbi:MAG: ABC transporter ATP-binding protein [Clostridiales bacterium]
MLEVKNMSVNFGSINIVDDISFSLGEKQWLMVVGPNGAGKSTIVNAISQGIDYQGQILFHGVDIASWKPAALARSIGILAQHHYVGYSFTVEEVVRLGRYAYSGGIFSSDSDEDEAMVEKALDITGMKPFRHQSATTLSGGELQRTFLAQIFAQNPRLLILDEPTNHLDLVFQKQVFGLIKDWVQESGRAVMSVVHDLNLVKSYGTDAILLQQGKLIASGTVDQVMTRENLSAVYAMDVYGWMQHMLEQWQD